MINVAEMVETGIVDTERIMEALEAWKEPHRFYHNMGHLTSLIKQIETSDLTYNEKIILEIAAVYHDVVYNPRSDSNEKDSVEIFKSHCLKENENTKLICNIILDTANDEPNEELGKLNVMFHAMDRSVLKGNFKELFVWEKKIFKEFQYANHKTYKKYRLEFLNKQIEIMEAKGEDTNAMKHLRDYVEMNKPNIGLYAGSFNPFHVGHMNILKEAERIFDKVIVAVGKNPDKLLQGALRHQKNPDKEFAADGIGPVMRVLPYHEVTTFDGFISDFIAENEETARITLIRGLRNGNDLDYESNQLRFIKGMKPNVKVISIMCDPEFEHISSSAIRNIRKIDPEKVKDYLP
jgi:pantetheine-phosphate adenylyltransferase